MKQILAALIVFSLTLSACDGGTETTTTTKVVTEKKTKLEDLKKQQEKLNQEIIALEQELVKLDPSQKTEKPKLVAVAPVSSQNFNHYIDLQGKVDAENVAYVTARNGGGQVKGVYVKQGEYVNKGKLLLKLDDALIRSQIEQAKTQLAFAKDLYNRRNNLWKQNIGTEVELISAKNNVDQAQNQLNLLNEQLSFTNVYAGMSGVADEVTIRVGEMFTGNPQMGGYIKVVNTGNLKVTVPVPENYIASVKTGTPMIVNIPETNQTFNLTVSSVGKTIDPNSRSFYVEARLPSSKNFKPNQVATVKILDYAVSNAITIPLNTMQKDEKGSFVLVAATENGNMVARKKAIEYGELYGNMLEVKSGLSEGDQVITDGFQNLFDGQLITTQ